MLAVDLGGTRIKAAVVDGARSSHSMVQAVGDDPVGELLGVVRSLGETATCAAVGLAVPGLADEAGRVRSLPGKLAGLPGVDLPALVRDGVGLPAVVVNDAVAHAVGEAVHGAGAGIDRVLVVTIGTGVGVAVVDRRDPPGAWLRATASLGGFIPISERTAGAADSMGRHDTIEALCAAARIVDCARRAGATADSVEDVLAAVGRGDDPASRGLDEYRSLLTRALLALTHAHRPTAVVVGGGPLAGGPLLLEGVQQRLEKLLYPGCAVSVRAAALGDTAALVGLGVLAADVL